MPQHTFTGARFAGRPLLMHAPRMADLFSLAAPDRHPGLAARLAALLPVARATRPAPPALYHPAGAQSVIATQGKYVIADDIAVIDIEGPLLARGICGDYCFAWGYDWIAATAAAIAADERARAVFIRLDSPGGMVAGVHEAEAALAALRGTGKPVHVYTPAICASAAMWLAAGADTITAAPTAEIGSVGVVWVHVSEAGWLEQAGLEITPIQFGDKKTDAAWWHALSDPARADMQAEIDAIGEMFVAAVATGRGLDAAAVRDQQAGLFMGEAAVAAGLADTIALEGQAFAALRDTINPDSGGAIPALAPGAVARTGHSAKARDCAPAAANQPEKEIEMSLSGTLAKIFGRAAQAMTAKQLAAIRAAAEDDGATAADPADPDDDGDAKKDDDADGDGAAAADPADPDDDGDSKKDDDEDGDGSDTVEASVLRRVTAITGSKEARGREKLAAKLAAQPGMTVASACAILRTAPRASALADSMAGQDPAITAGGGTPAPADADDPINAFIAAGQGHRLVRNQQRRA